MILAAASCRAAPASGTASLAVQGQVTRPHVFTLAELHAMPVIHVDVTTATDRDATPRHAMYDGVLLWTLLDGVGMIDAPGRKTRPLHVFLARGADGYAVAVSIGEVAPMYEAKQVIVAYAKDGGALAGLELVVPGDRRAARFVKNLSAIDVR